MSHCENTLVVLVDDDDNEVGTAQKIDAHRKAQLHRAFSVFLFNDELVLLQKRTQNKYHSGGLWSNACCSHPLEGESVIEAAQRRLINELGIDPHGLSDLIDKGSFWYRADFSNGISENEIDHVLVGTYQGPIRPNPCEVEKVRWASTDKIKEEIQQDPDKFTCWFSQAFSIALEKMELNTADNKSIDPEEP